MTTAKRASQVAALARVRDENGTAMYSAADIQEITGFFQSTVINTLRTVGRPDIQEGDRVVAIEITDQGVRVDHLADVSVHFALRVFPELDEVDYEKLRVDIEANGQREPILVTEDGRILDGRARWRICKDAGITPVTKVVADNPWFTTLPLNAGRISSQTQRAMICARVPVTKRHANQSRRPPVGEELAGIFDIPEVSIRYARGVYASGTDVTVQATWDGVIPLGTGFRIAKTMTPAQQDRFMDRIDAGESTRLANKDPAAPVAHIDNHRQDRHRYVTMPAIRKIVDSLTSLGIVVESVQGLDPAIDADTAAQLARELNSAHRSYLRLVAILKERKESA